MDRIQKQILKSQNKIAQLKAKQRDRDLKKKKIKSKTPGKSGRPAIDDELILRAIKLAEDKPLTDVALRLGVSLRTLYNKGISRRMLEAKTS